MKVYMLRRVNFPGSITHRCRMMMLYIL